MKRNKNSHAHHGHTFFFFSLFKEKNWGKNAYSASEYFGFYGGS